MPCNAKVVINAKVKVTEKYRGSNTPRVAFGQVEAIIDKDGNAILRYYGDSWEDGVEQLRRLVKYLSDEAGLEFESLGEPETHRHDQPGPWQRARA
jgi:hypothetical protein